MQAVRDLKSIVRLDQNVFGRRVDLAHMITTVHNEFLPFAPLLDNAPFFDKLTEGRRRTVHNGHFVANLDQQIGNAIGVQGGHEMFDCFDRDALLVQRRAKVRRRNKINSGRQRFACCDIPEHNAAVGRYRLENNARLNTGLQP